MSSYSLKPVILDYTRAFLKESTIGYPRIAPEGYMTHHELGISIAHMTTLANTQESMRKVKQVSESLAHLGNTQTPVCSLSGSFWDDDSSDNNLDKVLRYTETLPIQKLQTETELLEVFTHMEQAYTDYPDGVTTGIYTTPRLTVIPTTVHTPPLVNIYPTSALLGFSESPEFINTEWERVQKIRTNQYFALTPHELDNFLQALFRNAYSVRKDMPGQIHLPAITPPSIKEPYSQWTLWNVNQFTTHYYTADSHEIDNTTPQYNNPTSHRYLEESIPHKVKGIYNTGRIYQDNHAVFGMQDKEFFNTQEAFYRRMTEPTTTWHDLIQEEHDKSDMNNSPAPSAEHQQWVRAPGSALEIEFKLSVSNLGLTKSLNLHSIRGEDTTQPYYILSYM